MQDTGLSVQKRVIKLLKSFYFVTKDNQRRIYIATRLVLCMLDEDDMVKELAMRTIKDLWFPSASVANTQGSSKTCAFASSVPQDKGQLQSKVVVIMGTAANFRDRQSPLENILHKIMAEKEGAEATSLHVHYAEICETLINGLVDASDLPGFVSGCVYGNEIHTDSAMETIMNCIRTIYLFSAAHPPI
jgi:cohesin loading factor subunit SCC2